MNNYHTLSLKNVHEFFSSLLFLGIFFFSVTLCSDIPYWEIISLQDLHIEIICHVSRLDFFFKRLEMYYYVFNIAFLPFAKLNKAISIEYFNSVGRIKAVESPAPPSTHSLLRQVFTDHH